jgi:protein-disulfide isomerase
MPDYVRGNPNAKVVLLEYADFECPYCGMAEPYVERAVDRFKDRIAYIFRPFPLTEIHPHAMHAAQAAEAAGLQDRFWEMHDTLFKHRKQLDDRDLQQYAKNLGLDIKRFENDFASAAVIDAIETTVREGEDDGVQGTPAFYLNGKPLEINQYDDIERSLEEALR